jgi:Flp pilus assembly pilin Flp
LIRQVSRTLNRLGDILKRLKDDESGQGTVEYVLVLSVSVVAASQLGARLLSALDKMVLTLAAQLERDIKTGRLGPGAWQN